MGAERARDEGHGGGEPGHGRDAGASTEVGRLHCRPAGSRGGVRDVGRRCCAGAERGGVHGGDGPRQDRPTARHDRHEERGRDPEAQPLHVRPLLHADRGEPDGGRGRRRDDRGRPGRGNRAEHDGGGVLHPAAHRRRDRFHRGYRRAGAVAGRDGACRRLLADIPARLFSSMRAVGRPCHVRGQVHGERPTLPGSCAGSAT